MMNRYFGIIAVTNLLAMPASAQGAGAPAAGPSLMSTVFMMVMLFVFFYFLILRPQNQQRKQHQAMIDAVRRGDTVVTSGGLVGKVTKVGEQELTVELADNVRVRIMRRMIVDVRGKGQLVPANDSKPA